MTFEQVMLSILVSAVSALWVRLTVMQRRLDDLIQKEASCQSKLDVLQRTLEAKHEENQQALAALYCKRNPE